MISFSEDNINPSGIFGTRRTLSPRTQDGKFLIGKCFQECKQKIPSWEIEAEPSTLFYSLLLPSSPFPSFLLPSTSFVFPFYSSILPSHLFCSLLLPSTPFSSLLLYLHYWAVFELLGCIWRTGLYLKYRAIIEVLGCIWSTRLYLKYQPVFEVAGCIWTTGLYLKYRALF